MSSLHRVPLCFRLLTLVAMFALGGCTAVPRTADPVAAKQAAAWVLDRLYLGRSIPAGGEVSEAQWTRFLAEVVTPRFPNGFTVLAGQGQWRDKTGGIEHERSFILEFVHRDDAATEKAVQEIAADYKRRFAQEAVLRVREQVEASF